MKTRQISIGQGEKGTEKERETYLDKEHTLMNKKGKLGTGKVNEM